MMIRLRHAAALGSAVAVAAAVCLPFTNGLAGAVAPSSHKFSNAAALSFIRSSLRNVHIGGTIKGLHVATSGGISTTTTPVTSTNWSGYADLAATGSTFTNVRAQWKEPTVTCPTTGSGVSLAAFWVGLDGFNDQTVEQDGTIAECYGSLFLGYADWWEMYPANAVQVVSSAVSAGDVIIASVNFKSGSYTLRVTDKTNTAASFSTAQTCGSGSTCSNTSAEWIGEAPCCSGNTVYPLAQFTNWRVINATARSGGVTGSIRHWTNDSITMQDSASPPVKMAAPGALSSTGKAFTDKWYANS